MKGILNKYTLNFFRRNQFTTMGISNMTEEQKSVFIYRVFAGIPLPLIIAEELPNGFSVLVGNPEVTTMLEYLNDEFSISPVDIPLEDCGEIIFGQKFSELSDDLKERFLEKEFVLQVFRSLYQQDKNEIYDAFRNPAIAIKADRDNPVDDVETPTAQSLTQLESIVISRYLENAFFKVVNMSPVTSDIIIQLMMMNAYDGTPIELSSKKVAEYKEFLDNEYDIVGKKSWIIDIAKTLDYLAKAYSNTPRTYLKKLHLPMIFLCAKTAIADGVKEKDFLTIIDEFFDSDNSEYKKACDSGTASKSNVGKRINSMIQFYNSNK